MEADGAWNKPSIEQQQILALVASLTQKYSKTTNDNDTNNESNEDKFHSSILSGQRLHLQKVS